MIKMIWPMAKNMILTLTGISMISGIVLEHEWTAIIMRSTGVLIVSGMGLMFLCTVITRVYKREEISMKRKQGEKKEMDKQTESVRADKAAA